MVHILQHAIPKRNTVSPELSTITLVSNGKLLRSSLTHFPNFVNGQTCNWLLSNCEAQPVLSKASYLNLQFTSNSFLMIILLNNKLEHDSHCKKGQQFLKLVNNLCNTESSFQFVFWAPVLLPSGLLLTGIFIFVHEFLNQAPQFDLLSLD